MLNCKFCGSSDFIDSHLPNTRYNNKLFNYLQCNHCGVIRVSPFPSEEDYLKMYPPSYQMGVNDRITVETKLPGLRFTYQKHFDLLNKFSPGKNILDYGCGNANFLINANQAGYTCSGVEFNPEHVNVLKKSLPSVYFNTIVDFLNGSDLKFDAIRLSNVLEHLEDPIVVLNQLSKHLSKNGVFIIEGPLELNYSFAYAFRFLYFKISKILRPNRNVTHSPTHLFFTNATNQLLLFEKCRLQKVYFLTEDNEWPYPEKIAEVSGIGSLVKFVIARISKFISKVIPLTGNTFIYVGKLNE